MQRRGENNKESMQSFQYVEDSLVPPVAPDESRNAAEESKRLLICTGAPFSEDKDKYMAEQVRAYRGKKIVCGGTSSQILSREWKEELRVDMDSMEAGLPPISYMRGIDLVTEGVITLKALTEILEQDTQEKCRQKGAAWEIYKMIREAEEIDMLVGTKNNPAHQSPKLIGLLANRQELVENIAHTLKKQYGKTIRIKRL